MKKLVLASLVAGFAVAGNIPNCAGCHDLSYLSSKEISAKMHKFKEGQGNPMMVNIAKGLSDEDIEKVSKEYGKK